MQTPPGAYVVQTEKADDTLIDPKLETANKLFQTAVVLLYGKRKSVEKAIKCLQKVIVLNDTNYKYWLLLGEAYYQRGSLNPSINSFIKSLTLAEAQLIGQNSTQDDKQRKRIQVDCAYSRLRVSDIRFSVVHLDEAIAGYDELVKSNPNDVAALIGLSKAYLQTARNCFSSGLVKSGHIRCMDALTYALRAAKLSPNLCHTWKLASDCCLIQFVFGQRCDFEAKIRVNLFSNSPSDCEDGFLLNRATCIQLAEQFLCKALNIEPYDKSCCLWHNLGISLYFKSSLLSDIDSERQVLLERSLKCLVKALDCDRNNSQVRNSIGVVAFNLNCLNSAQNFIIGSIKTNLSTSEVQFSNLGYIYLQKGEFRLASVAFSRCQAEEPLYCRSWLGNALVNEQFKTDNLSLLRHCHRLENNYESQLLYATKVLSLPRTAEYSKDVVNALDCMRKIVEYDKFSVEAINTLGLLFERNKFVDQASKCFDDAYSICPRDSRVIFNKLRQLDARENTCTSKSNVLEAQNSAHDLIKAAEKLAAGNNSEYMLNFVYYLFKNADYATIGTRMTKVIDKLRPDDTHNRIGAQILLALVDKKSEKDFKSWLYKNIIDSENVICIESLINLLCLMVLNRDASDAQELMRQISGDYNKYLVSYLSSFRIPFAGIYYSDTGVWIRLALLSSIFCLDDPGKLIRPLVALFPFNAELWLLLGLALVCTDKKVCDSKVAIHCLKKSQLLGSTDEDLNFVRDILMAILCSRLPASDRKVEQLSERPKYLCRACSKYPTYLLLWDALDHEQAPRNQQMKDTLNAMNSKLTKLAIDHMIKMIVA